MKVYLAGPMRGRPRYNFDVFEQVTAWLRQLGHEVISPAEHDLDMGIDPNLPLEVQDFDLRDALAWDLQQVLAVDAVVVLPGWAHSLGAAAEVATARAVGTPVLDCVELLGIPARSNRARLAA